MFTKLTGVISILMSPCQAMDSDFFKHEAELLSPKQYLSINSEEPLRTEILETIEKLEKNDPSFTSLNLYKPDMNSSEFQDFCQALGQNNTLKTMHLWEKDRKDQEIESLMKVLISHPQMKELFLSVVNLKPKGVGFIAEYLWQNPILSMFLINSCPVKDPGVLLFAKALKTNTHLTKLQLVQCGMTSSGAQALFKALEVNDVLSHLNISTNNLGDKWAHKLKLPPALKCLEATSVGLSKKGALALFKSLESNKTLEDLNLSYNLVGSDWATISPCVRPLKSLNLYGCHLSKEDAHIIFKSLEHNFTLEELKLGYNKIGDPLAYALVPDIYLRSLDLTACEITNNGAATIFRFLQNNSSLKSLSLMHNLIEDEWTLVLAGEFSKRGSFSEYNFRNKSLNTETIMKLNEFAKGEKKK